MALTNTFVAETGQGDHPKSALLPEQGTASRQRKQEGARQPESVPKEVLTMKEGAQYLTISKRLFDELVKRGEIQTFKIRRRRCVRRRDLDEFIARCIEDEEAAHRQ